MSESDMNQEPDAISRYQVYVLRLWQEADTAVWRYSLENPQTGDQHRFDCLDALNAFLTARSNGYQQENSE